MMPIPPARRVRAPVAPAVPTEYDFHISAHVEKRMGRWRATVREEIRRRLAEIAASAGKSRLKTKTKTKTKALDRKDPALRFYVYEGYRICYQIDEENRLVVVSDIELLEVA
jgi:mRNA-degrading endonuclease RelE of RelBE toxin-antitoxin system